MGSNSITPSLLGTNSNALQEDNSLGGECEGEEEGAHDTITSLAGVKMIQRYRGSIRKGRRSSQSEDQLSGHQRLEDLFLIEEDGKDETLYDEPLEIISRDEFCKPSDNKGTTTQSKYFGGEKILILLVLIKTHNNHNF